MIGRVVGQVSIRNRQRQGRRSPPPQDRLSLIESSPERSTQMVSEALVAEKAC